MTNDRYSFVDFEEDEDTNIYCPMCENLGFLGVRMGPKLILEGEQRQPDHDSFLQCPSCGWLCPIHEVGQEPEIQDTAQTIESPYDNQEGIVMGAENRATSRKKKQASSNRVTRPTSKRRRNKLKLDEDEEINNLLEKYGDNVKVLK